MQSFLVVGNKDKVKEKILNIVTTRKVDKFDTQILEFEKQMGIPDVRLIQKSIYLKPFKSEEKAVVLFSFEGLTIEAQNALLKILEEPPENTIITIGTSVLDDILPTIISRCIVINEKNETDNDENTKSAEKIIALKSSPIGDRLKLAQDLSKEKGSALKFLETSIYGLNEMLLNDVENDKKTRDIKKDLEIMQEYYNSIKNTNVNLRLALENLFLSII